MKRDMDLVREMLLAMEAGGGGFRNADALGLPDQPSDKLWHHLAIMEDAQLVTRGTVAVYTGVGLRATKSSEHPGEYRMTWEGHDFLDTVRDPEVWKRTKAGAGKIGGVAFGLMKDMATAYAKHLLKERLNLDL